MYNLFEKSNNSQDEIVLEYFRLFPDEDKIKDLSAEVSLIANDDHVDQILEEGSFNKEEDENANEEE